MLIVLPPISAHFERSREAPPSAVEAEALSVISIVFLELKQRERIKRQNIEYRRMQHRKLAA